MASISGTSSLGNTSIRGYGGFASGIDRDAIIEQMTMGTTTKITNQKKSMTSLSWKQESYQSISSKMLQLQDNYFSYSSGINLKDASSFAKNQITTMGKTDIAKLVTATGSSDMLDYMAISGVKQLASAATRLSGQKGSSSITTKITGNIAGTTPADMVHKSSNLRGTELKFGTYNTDGSFKTEGTFTFPTSYQVTEADGKVKTVTIDYTADPDKVVDQLNEALKQSEFKLGDDGKIKFKYDPGTEKISIETEGAAGNYVIRESSSALKALGFDSGQLSESDLKDGISISEFNTDANKVKFSDTYVTRQNMVQYLTGKKLSVTFGGQTKEIELIKGNENPPITDLDGLQKVLDERLTRAFGRDKVSVTVTNGAIEFNTGTDAAESQTLTISSNDEEILKTLGIAKNASTKLSMDSSLKDNADKLAGSDFLTSLVTGGLKINGVEIEGINENSTMNEVIEKINASKDAGVKASYLSNSNQLVLVAKETGSGRNITLDSAAAEALFGITPTPTSTPGVSNGVAGENKDGKNAQIEVSYGDGITTQIESSSNTFQLEGLNITVTGTFGYKTVTVEEPKMDDTGNPVVGDDGNPVMVKVEKQVLDSDQAVTFSAKADVDGITEKIAKFIEEYNAMVTEINKQVSTRPNKSYGPLTDEQKAEMTETSIENWEKKAKEGLLFNDSTMRDLSMDMQGMMTKFLSSGVDYEKLKEIGVEISDDYLAGGLITFNEAKFKEVMTSNPEKVADIFAGDSSGTPGIAKVMEETFTTYATKYASRNGNSYGRLIEEAGSEMIPLSVSNNQIYKQLKDMEENLAKLQVRLSNEQDRFVSRYTTMETLISKMNNQSSWLANL